MSDYFSVGVVAYQCVFGKRPILSSEMIKAVLANSTKIEYELPDDWSAESKDFITACLMLDPAQRLGSQGIQQIKNHAWFDGFSWDELISGEMVAPYIPD